VDRGYTADAHARDVRPGCLAELRLLARGQPDAVLEAARDKPIAGVRGRDDRAAKVNRPQRREISVVRVQVGQQHRVHRSDGDWGGRGAQAPQVSDPITKDRIGQDPHAAKLDQRR
jgi:hypothetical protein